MDILFPQTNTETPTESPQPTGAMNTSQDINIVSLNGYFGEKNPNFEDIEAVEYIYKFFSNTGITEMASILLSLRTIENKIGATPLGLSRSQHIFQYLKLQAGIANLQAQSKQMEHGSF